MFTTEPEKPIGRDRNHRFRQISMSIFLYIIKRKQRQEALKKSEARFRTLFEQSNLAIQIVDQNGHTLLVNRRWEELWGVSIEAVSNYNLLQDKQLIDRGVMPLIHKAFAGEAVVIPEFEYDRAAVPEVPGQSGKVWVRTFMYPRIADDNIVREVVLVQEDVSHLIKTEKRLRRSEESLAEAQRIAHLGNWDWNIVTNELVWSDEIYRIFGQTPQSFGATYDAFLEYVHPEDRELVQEAVTQALHERVSYNIDHRIVRDEGTVMTVHEQGEVFRDETGKPVRMIGTVQDITERKGTYQRLTLLDFALNHVRESAFLIDETARFHYVNDEACRILGYTHDELLGMRVSDVDPDFPAARWPNHWNELKTAGSLIFEGRHKVKGGGIIPVEINANYFEYDGRSYNLALVRDITERKKAEEALKKEEEFNRNILDTVLEGFIVVDRDYRLVSANKAFCSMMQTSEDQLIGRTCYEITHRSSRPCFEQGMDCPVRRTFETGASHFASHSYMSKFGTKRYQELKSFPITDASGNVVSAIEVINDVTEKRKLEDQVIQAQKMESVGRLAGGVAHDFNNMLGVILGYTNLTLKQMDPGQPFYADLQEVRNAAKRSAGLTRQLLAFARKQTIAPKVLDLNETVEGMLKMLRRLIGEDIDFVWLPAKEVWPIKMDPSQIDQILANLCVNASDAIVGVGKITIKTNTATIDAAYCLDHPGMVAGDYVLLTVTDSGCGMDKETLGKLFEPFFTTKEKGKGTGLGLATVYGIVKQNKGYIDVYSTPGCGSTFKLYLPHYETEAKEMPPKSQVGPGEGHETILLVEDESAHLEITRRMLELSGYRVLVASTPDEAIRATEEHLGEIDLLITDVVMPRMNGLELSQHLNSLQSGLRCLFMSGYTDDVLASHGVLDEGVHLIQKPFSRPELAGKVRKTLDSK